MKAVTMGQIQWLLFWAAILIDMPGLWPLWFVSLFFGDYGDK